MKKLILFIASVVLCGVMHAQSYHYSYNYHDYENSTPCIGEVYLDGVALTSSDFEIAAFVGDQVRSTEFLFEADPANYPGHYYAWLGISFNNAGEIVTFRLFDHTTNTEYSICFTTWVLNSNGVGETWDPLIISFSSMNYGPTYPWVVTGSYENYMYLEAQIQIDGVPVTNTNWEVGAFCGDICRGLGDADNWWISPINNSNLLEIVVGGATGDVINFYLYDVTNSEIFHGFCFTTLDWIDGDIGDMFEPYIINFVTAQTFTKNIVGYTGDQDHYYLVASPIRDVNPLVVTNMLSNNYDLYYFDQAQDQEWINYEGSEGNFNLVSGKGYLYANSADVTLTFTGFPESGSTKEIPVIYDENAVLKGWNLIGNPFAEAAYLADAAVSGTALAYYKMNNNGNGFTAVENGAAIPAMEGVFFQATTTGNVYFTKTAPTGTKSGSLSINVSQNRSSIDNAIIRFGEGNTLEKYCFRENSTKVYIPQNGIDFALVNAESDGEIPVCFKAETDGTFMLSFSYENVTLGYLHLIDNLTGNNVDLLANPNYTFTAKTSDYASRFKLVFATGNASDDHFAFFSNGKLIINNDGIATLQVIDINGRILSNENINGCYSKTIHATTGVYMLRLINGSEVKTQKIVIE